MEFEEIHQKALALRAAEVLQIPKLKKMGCGEMCKLIGTLAKGGHEFPARHMFYVTQQYSEEMMSGGDVAAWCAALRVGPLPADKNDFTSEPFADEPCFAAWDYNSPSFAAAIGAVGTEEDSMKGYLEVVSLTTASYIKLFGRRCARSLGIIRCQPRRQANQSVACMFDQCHFCVNPTEYTSKILYSEPQASAPKRGFVFGPSRFIGMYSLSNRPPRRHGLQRPRRGSPTRTWGPFSSKPCTRS